MKRNLLFTLLALLATSLWAEEKTDSVVITGNVLDSYTREYLDSVSVELQALISGRTISRDLIADPASNPDYSEEQIRMINKYQPPVKRRMYTLEALPGTYTLVLSRAGYKEKEVQVTIPARRYGRPTETWEVKNVLMDRTRRYELGEAVVRATKVKMVTRGDTVIYNADAFQLAEGSMLDALVAMMPGLEIRGSRIYQNGEYVPELLLNGKDFFKGDATVALKNLPAYTVKDLRIYHRAPEDAYLRKDWTHEDTLSWGKVLDVRLRKQYSHGWITNAELAAGPRPTPDPSHGGRGVSALDGKWAWLARLFGLHFSDHTRLGVFANFNNINDTGTASSDGDWSSSWTPDDGVTTMKLGALDFSVDGKKSKLKYNLNLQAVQETTDSERETSSTTFLPTGDVFSRSRNKNTHDRFHLVWNNTLNWQGKKAYFYFKPGVDFFRRNNDGMSLTAQFDADPMDSHRGAALDSIFGSTRYDGYLAPYSPRLQQMLVNRTSLLYASREDFWWEVVRLGTTFRSPWTGNNISINLYQQYKHQNLEKSEQYALEMRSGSEAENFQNRYLFMPSQDYHSVLDVKYTLHRFGKFSSYVGYQHVKNVVKHTRDYYRLDHLDEEWADAEQAPDLFVLPSTSDWRSIAIDMDNTYRAKTREDCHMLMPRLEYSGKRLGFVLKPDLIYSYDRRSDTRAEQLEVKRHFLAISPTASVSYRYRGIGVKDGRDRGYLSLSYGLSNDAPDISYLLDVRDASDPLRVTLGNAHLHRGLTHSLSFRQHLYSNRRSISSHLSYYRRQHQVAQAMTYDPETGVYTYRPENVNGNWSLNGGLYMTFTPKESPFSFSTSTNASYNNSVDLISPDGVSSAVRSVVRNTSGSQGLNVSYTRGKVTASLMGNIGIEHAASERQNFRDRTTYSYTYGGRLAANNFWLGLSLASDLSMRHLRGYDDASMNENVLVWNAQLSRAFGRQGQWNLKLKGHDLLRQLSNTRRTINAQGITETWVNSLPSYVMLHISYRWNKNPKK
ncbi:MAG: outer membrane beta-barrel family protein [Bacteroidaceae bacterium]|nr:outer membrane beta-barrel family protein [Bacteroidaceae bacterium]